MAPEYVKLTEHNEWEGETWHFYIPLDGNKDTLDRLADALSILAGADEEPEFELELAPMTETEVDTLVRHGGDTDYMAAHNKLEGRLVLPDGALDTLRLGDVDPLYKGRICDHMKAS